MYTDFQIPRQVCRPGVAACTENLISRIETKEYVARGTLHNPITSGQFHSNYLCKSDSILRSAKYYSTKVHGLYGQVCR